MGQRGCNPLEMRWKLALDWAKKFLGKRKSPNPHSKNRILHYLGQESGSPAAHPQNHAGLVLHLTTTATSLAHRSHVQSSNKQRQGSRNLMAKLESTKLGNATLYQDWNLETPPTAARIDLVQLL